METLKMFLFVILALVFIFVILEISWKLLKFQSTVREFTLKGEKNQTIDRLLDLIYQCYNENKDKKVSVVCFKIKYEGTESIKSPEILENINSRIIDRAKVIVSDIEPNSNIIIRYENNLIYVEVFRGEGIGA